MPQFDRASIHDEQLSLMESVQSFYVNFLRRLRDANSV
jgi:hypothetical protein